MRKLPTTYSGVGLFGIGMGQVVIVRYKGGGRVELGVFLLDVFCLGVKNAFFHSCTEEELEERLKGLFENTDSMEEHSGAWGRKLVEGALEYARSLGFAPHSNYKKAARVMGGIDPNACPETFVFGQNGKPMSISGPNDNEARCRIIHSVLTKKFGHDGFHFMQALGDGGFDGLFDEDEDDDEGK